MLDTVDQLPHRSIVRSLGIAGLVIVQVIAMSGLAVAQSDSSWRVVDSTETFIPSRYMYSVACADDLHCVVTGKECDRKCDDLIKLTTDGGETWTEILRQELTSFGVGRIREICYPSTGLIIAVGDSGIIIKSTDGGSSWSRKFVTTANLENIDMANERVGSIVGPNLMGTLRTEDGGETWDYIRFDDTLRFAHEVQTPTDSTVIVNTVKSQQGWTILRSNDGGRSFEALGRPSRRSYSLLYFDANIGWSIGARQYGDYVEQSTDVVERTTDGGLTWTLSLDTMVTTVGGLISASFADSANVIAVGFNANVWRTTDGGGSWRREPNRLNPAEVPTLTDVAFPSLRRAVATCVSRGQVLVYTGPAARVTRDTAITIGAIRMTLDGGELKIAAKDDRIHRVLLFDMTGQTVVQTVAREGTNAVALSVNGLRNAVYCVHVEHGNGVWRSIVSLSSEALGFSVGH